MLITHSPAAISGNSLNAGASTQTKPASGTSLGHRRIDSDDCTVGGTSCRHSTDDRLADIQSGVTNAVTFTQIQDGYLQQAGKLFSRMRELAALSQDDTFSGEQRTASSQEFSELKDRLQSISKKEFEGISLFSHAASKIEADLSGTEFEMKGIDLAGGSYAAASSGFLNTPADAKAALATLDAALDQLEADRSTIAGYQSQLHEINDRLTGEREELISGSSRIGNYDLAQAGTGYARTQILGNSDTSVLVQANSRPHSVFDLLQGAFA